MTAHVLPQRNIRRTKRGVLMLPFACLAVLVLGAGIFVSYVLWPTWPSRPVPLNAPAMPITVANVLFDVPPAAIRAAVQRHPGPHERVDLAFLWPSLKPPQPDAKAADQPAAGNDGDTAPKPVDTTQRLFVTIAGLGSVLPPADRLRTIYPRYIEAQASRRPGRACHRAVSRRHAVRRRGFGLCRDHARAVLRPLHAPGRHRARHLPV